jgi:hypothetical protein
MNVIHKHENSFLFYCSIWGKMMGEMMAVNKQTRGKGKSQETACKQWHSKGHYQGYSEHRKRQNTKGWIQMEDSREMEMHRRREDSLTGAMPQNGIVHWV